LLERRDTLIVASVSCIYGLGSPEAYFDMMVYVEEGATIERDQMLRKLVDIRYERSDYDFHRGTFRVRGDIVEVFPAYEDSSALRIEFFDEIIEAIHEIDPIRGKILRRVDKACIYPASHYVTGEDRMKEAIRAIRGELQERLVQLREENKLLEAQRLEQRTLYDLELLEEMGFCPASRTTRAIDRAKTRRAAADAAQLFPGRFSTDDRRKPCHRPADRWDVPRRPLAQRDVGRVRLSPPFGAR
jgi:excinuclease ABC subunit B